MTFLENARIAPPSLIRRMELRAALSDGALTESEVQAKIAPHARSLCWGQDGFDGGYRDELVRLAYSWQPGADVTPGAQRALDRLLSAPCKSDDAELIPHMPPPELPEVERARDHVRKLDGVADAWISQFTLRLVVVLKSDDPAVKQRVLETVRAQAGGWPVEFRLSGK